MSDKITVYYYTDEEDVIEIQGNGKIEPSIGQYGNGVYLTSLPPSLGKERIAANNHTNISKEDMEDVDRAIELLIPQRKLHRVDGPRDIYIYCCNKGKNGEGKTMILNAYMVGIHTLDWKQRIADADRFGAAYHT